MENLKAKKYFVGLLFIVAAILIFGYLQLDWFGKNKTDTNWLMVLHAGEAKITESSGEIFLTLSETSSNTVFFSDRPQRKYQSIDTNIFLEQWDNLFVNSPPNAAMTHAEEGIDTQVVVIELFKPVITENDISFPIKIVGGDYEKDKTYEDINLFIEDAFEDWWKGVVRAEITGESSGDSPTGISLIESSLKNSITILAKAVDTDGWEEDLQDSIIRAVTVAANIGGDAGEASGIENGRQLGSRVGTRLGITAIQTAIKAIMRSDIDGSSYLDVDALSVEIIEAVSIAADYFKVAYAITDNILNSQEENIETKFSELIDGLIALNTTSGNNIFCTAIYEDSDELFDTFYYYLRIGIEGRVYYDLQSGMSFSQIKTDVNDNLEDDIEFAIKYTIWVLLDTCLSTKDDDLYTQVFFQIFLATLLDSDSDGITDQYEPADFLRTDGRWTTDINNDGIPDEDLMGDSIPNLDLNGNNLADLDQVSADIDTYFAGTDANVEFELDISGEAFNPLNDLAELRYTGYRNPPSTPVYTIAEFEIAEAGADFSVSSPFSSIKDQFTQFTTKSNEKLLQESTNQFDLLINEGFDFYVEDIADLDFITQDLIDEIAENALEEAIVDEAGNVIGE